MYYFGKTIFQIWYDFETDKQKNEVFYDIKNELILKPEFSLRFSKDNIFVNNFLKNMILIIRSASYKKIIFIKSKFKT